MYIIHLLSLTILLLPGVVWGSTAEETAATNFVPLVGIPYVQGEKVATFGDYVNAFYYASISIAAFLAVVRIIFAGVKYMLTDIVTKKGDAKNDIRSALFGLLIVVGAVLILNTINTNLTEIKLFSNAPSPGVEGGRDTIDVNERCNVTTGCTDVPTCKDSEQLVQSIGDSGTITYSCVSKETPPRDNPPGTESITINYICLSTQNPNGCFLPHQFLKSSAEAECDRLEGELVDDPTTHGKGICYYIPQ